MRPNVHWHTTKLITNCLRCTKSIKCGPCLKIPQNQIWWSIYETWLKNYDGGPLVEQTWLWRHRHNFWGRGYTCGIWDQSVGSASSESCRFQSGAFKNWTCFIMTNQIWRPCHPLFITTHVKLFLSSFCCVQDVLSCWWGPLSSGVYISLYSTLTL